METRFVFGLVRMCGRVVKAVIRFEFWGPYCTMAPYRISGTPRRGHNLEDNLFEHQEQRIKHTVLIGFEIWV